jgi:hypothetical protein
MTNTAVVPGDGDAAVLRVKGTAKGVAMTTDGNSRLVYLDPYQGGKLAVCEAARNLACVGARPLVAGYESQLIEFANTNPRDYAQLKDDVVMLYPVPTVWSSHVYIALSDKGRRVVDAMMDPLIQQNAWEKHGFRTGVNAASVDTSTLPVQGVAPVVSRIIQMPDSGTMETIIQALE